MARLVITRWRSTQCLIQNVRLGSFAAQPATEAAVQRAMAGEPAVPAAGAVAVVAGVAGADLPSRAGCKNAQAEGGNGTSVVAARFLFLRPYNEVTKHR